MASLFENTNNTRFLCGGSIASGRYIRSDVPTILEDREIEWLIENNFCKVIDLRTQHAVLNKPCPLKDRKEFSYKVMTVTGGNKVPDNPQLVVPSYLNMVDGKMQEIISEIENSKENVLFFCNAGKDRTGVVSALLLLRAGADCEEIIADYVQSYENLKEILQEYAAETGTDINIITPKAEYMREFLKLL